MTNLEMTLLANSEDFLNTAEVLFDLNRQGHLSDKKLLFNLKLKYMHYSEEKIRILNSLESEENV